MHATNSSLVSTSAIPSIKGPAFLNSKGIACRSGQHCAKILINYLKEVATVRASIYFYTTKEEIDALVDALRKSGDFLDAYFA